MSRACQCRPMPGTIGAASLLTSESGSGRCRPGRPNSVVDVPGVGLGHATVVARRADPPFGRGVARTGVTVVDLGGDASARPCRPGSRCSTARASSPARCRSTSGAWLETPVFLTSHDAGRPRLRRRLPAAHGRAAARSASTTSSSRWSASATTPGSTTRAHMHVTDEHVAAALARAPVRPSAPGVAPDEGAVGAGTGMSCFGWKGGIGTSSRVLPDGHVVGVVLLTNFGQWDRLTVDGVAVGERSRPPAGAPQPAPAGSCLGVVVTDAPLDPAAATARAAGRARAGAHRVDGTPRQRRDLPGVSPPGCARRAGRHPVAPLAGPALDDLFGAAVDATEEAVSGHACWRRPRPPGGAATPCRAAVRTGSPHYWGRADRRAWC